jgi:opacity protein-like surface antigen
VSFSATAVVPLLGATAIAAPGDGRQAGNYDLAIGPVYSFSDAVSGQFGSSLDIDSDLGLQFGIDYFVSNRLSVGFDMTWTSPDYDALLVPEDGSDPVRVNHSAQLFNGQFNGAFNLIDGPLTPYVELSAGWTYLDSNIASEAPIVGCWWDPWWGYICDGFYATYSDTKFSYGAAVGVRWDFSRDSFFKAGYRLLEVETDGLQANPTIEQAAIEFGWRF